ncbi:unnamed protein product [Mytilus coruscus]|uniref:Uncharacterized protein n=1 Tax=Mytilus coruscus TaxID=42192 RepID=A0A6J8ABF0_MYTCO|nr:unnamed protein product [Mytilus coruscus]
MERDHIRQEHFDLRERVVEMRGRSMRRIFYSGLHVIFSTGVTTDLYNNDTSPNMVNIPVRWNSEMKDQFVETVEDKLSTEDLFKKLVTLNVESDTFQTDLDNFVEFFNSIFIDLAYKCFGDKVFVITSRIGKTSCFNHGLIKIVIRRDLNFTRQSE